MCPMASSITLSGEDLKKTARGGFWDPTQALCHLHQMLRCMLRQHGKSPQCLHHFSEQGRHSPTSHFDSCAKQSIWSNNDTGHRFQRKSSLHWESFINWNASINWMTDFMQSENGRSIIIKKGFLQYTPLQCCAGEWFENAFHLNLYSRLTYSKPPNYTEA